MSSKQSEAIKRFWTAARLAGELPADEQPDDESWGDLTAEPREVDYIEADAAGLPAMWATPKRGAEDRVLLCMHGGGFLAGSIYSHRKMFGHLDKVRAFLDDSPGGDKPVWITELGWQSEHVGEEQQATNLPRVYTVAMSRGVPRFNWYNFRDHSNKTFGLTQRNSGDEDSYAPKPSYVAYGVLTAQLAGLRHGHAEDVGDTVQSHVFTGGATPTRVMWVPGADTTVQFKAAGKVTVTDIMGHTRTLDTSDGTGELTLSGDVAYVHGSISSITVG